VVPSPFFPAIPTERQQKQEPNTIPKAQREREKRERGKIQKKKRNRKYIGKRRRGRVLPSG
jgi:hypothetical protein